VSNLTIGYGVALTAVGLGGFFATGAEHKTALIPAGFGVAAIGLGVLAKQERLRKPALRAAAVLGVLGLAGSARGLAKLSTLLAGGEVERPAAVIAQSAMAGLSALYLALSTRDLFSRR
jgi:hypothetical protein